MGSGQSKLGFGKQKQHYPFPTPTFPGGYGQYPQPYIPQYGLAGYPPVVPPTFPQPQVPQQGFVPPGIHTQGFIPPSQPKASHHERRSKKKKSSRRTQSENFPGGFSGEAQAQGQRNDEPRRAHSESHHRDGPSMPVPEIPRSTSVKHPPNVNNRRAPTPFIPPLGRDEEDRDDHERDRSRNHSRQSHIRYSTPPPIDGNIRNVLQPMERANGAAYGPGQRPLTPLKNPLPPPPRDIYDMTPYRAIVNLPHTTALLAGPYGPQSLSYVNAAADLERNSSTVKRNKSVKGILRAFSKREKNKEPQNSVQYVPIFVDGSSASQSLNQMPQAQMPQAQGTQVPLTMPMPQAQMPQMPPPQPQPQAQMPQPGLHRSSSQRSRNPVPTSMPVPDRQPEYLSTPHSGVRFPAGPNDSSPMQSHSHSSTSADTPIPPVPPVPSSPPPVRFGQGDALNGFLNHSVYRILYRNKTYPTGLHLHEAMKFIDHRPDIAETIRLCADVHSVYPLAAQFQQFQRPDWPAVYVDCMEQVILLKVRQHPDLRTLLMGTGTARIEYTDEHDEFWGTGRTGDGQNMLGKVMMRVREKLRVEGL